uniref:Uncharacterized protein n=1 Tax=Clytia hemisphaerica TaxID=252671 RepID=A0A7M5VFB4_9CNID
MMVWFRIMVLSFLAYTVTTQELQKAHFQIDHEAGRLKIEASKDEADIDFGNDKIDLLLKPGDVKRPAVEVADIFGHGKDKTRDNIHEEPQAKTLDEPVRNITWKGRINEEDRGLEADAHVLKTLKVLREMVLSEKERNGSKKKTPRFHSNDETLDQANSIIDKVEKTNNGDSSEDYEEEHPEDAKYAEKAKEILKDDAIESYTNNTKIEGLKITDESNVTSVDVDSTSSSTNLISEPNNVTQDDLSSKNHFNETDDSSKKEPSDSQMSAVGGTTLEQKKHISKFITDTFGIDLTKVASDNNAKSTSTSGNLQSSSESAKNITSENKIGKSSDNIETSENAHTIVALKQPETQNKQSHQNVTLNVSNVDEHNTDRNNSLYGPENKTVSIMEEQKISDKFSKDNKSAFGTSQAKNSTQIGNHVIDTQKENADLSVPYINTTLDHEDKIADQKVAEALGLTEKEDQIDDAANKIEKIKKAISRFVESSNPIEVDTDKDAKTNGQNTDPNKVQNTDQNKDKENNNKTIFIDGRESANGDKDKTFKEDSTKQHKQNNGTLEEKITESFKTGTTSDNKKPNDNNVDSSMISNADGTLPKKAFHNNTDSINESKEKQIMGTAKLANDSRNVNTDEKQTASPKEVTNAEMPAINLDELSIDRELEQVQKASEILYSQLSKMNPTPDSPEEKAYGSVTNKATLNATNEQFASPVHIANAQNFTEGVKESNEHKRVQRQAKKRTIVAWVPAQMKHHGHQMKKNRRSNILQTTRRETKTLNGFLSKFLKHKRNKIRRKNGKRSSVHHQIAKKRKRSKVKHLKNKRHPKVGDNEVKNAVATLESLLLEKQRLTSHRKPLSHVIERRNKIRTRYDDQDVFSRPIDPTTSWFKRDLKATSDDYYPSPQIYKAPIRDQNEIRSQISQTSNNKDVKAQTRSAFKSPEELEKELIAKVEKAKRLLKENFVDKKNKTLDEDTKVDSILYDKYQKQNVALTRKLGHILNDSKAVDNVLNKLDNEDVKKEEELNKKYKVITTTADDIYSKDKEILEEQLDRANNTAIDDLRRDKTDLANNGDGGYIDDGDPVARDSAPRSGFASRNTTQDEDPHSKLGFKARSYKNSSSVEMVDYARNSTISVPDHAKAESELHSMIDLTTSTDLKNAVSPYERSNTTSMEQAANENAEEPETDDSIYPEASVTKTSKIIDEDNGSGQIPKGFASPGNDDKMESNSDEKSLTNSNPEDYYLAYEKAEYGNAADKNIKEDKDVKTLAKPGKDGDSDAKLSESKTKGEEETKEKKEEKDKENSKVEDAEKDKSTNKDSGSDSKKSSKENESESVSNKDDKKVSDDKDAELKKQKLKEANSRITHVQLAGPNSMGFGLALNNNTFQNALTNNTKEKSNKDGTKVKGDKEGKEETGVLKLKDEESKTNVEKDEEKKLRKDEEDEEMKEKKVSEDKKLGSETLKMNNEERKTDEEKDEEKKLPKDEQEKVSDEEMKKSRKNEGEDSEEKKMKKEEDKEKNNDKENVKVEKLQSDKKKTNEEEEMKNASEEEKMLIDEGLRPEEKLSKNEKNKQKEEKLRKEEVGTHAQKDNQKKKEEKELRKEIDEELENGKKEEKNGQEENKTKASQQQHEDQAGKSDEKKKLDQSEDVSEMKNTDDENENPKNSTSTQSMTTSKEKSADDSKAVDGKDEEEKEEKIQNEEQEQNVSEKEEAKMSQLEDSKVQNTKSNELVADQSYHDNMPMGGMGIPQSRLLEEAGKLDEQKMAQKLDKNEEEENIKEDKKGSSELNKDMLKKIGDKKKESDESKSDVFKDDGDKIKKAKNDGDKEKKKDEEKVTDVNKKLAKEKNDGDKKTANKENVRDNTIGLKSDGDEKKEDKEKVPEVNKKIEEDKNNGDKKTEDKENDGDKKTEDKGSDGNEDQAAGEKEMKKSKELEIEEKITLAADKDKGDKKDNDNNDERVSEVKNDGDNNKETIELAEQGKQKKPLSRMEKEFEKALKEKEKEKKEEAKETKEVSKPSKDSKSSLDDKQIMAYEAEIQKQKSKSTKESEKQKNSQSDDGKNPSKTNQQLESGKAPNELKASSEATNQGGSIGPSSANQNQGSEISANQMKGISGSANQNPVDDVYSTMAALANKESLKSLEEKVSSNQNSVSNITSVQNQAVLLHQNNMTLNTLSNQQMNQSELANQNGFRSELTNQNGFQQAFHQKKKEDDHFVTTMGKEAPLITFREDKTKNESLKHMVKELRESLDAVDNSQTGISNDTNIHRPGETKHDVTESISNKEETAVQKIKDIKALQAKALKNRENAKQLFKAYKVLKAYKSLLQTMKNRNKTGEMLKTLSNYTEGSLQYMNDKVKEKASARALGDTTSQEQVAEGEMMKLKKIDEAKEKEIASKGINEYLGSSQKMEDLSKTTESSKRGEKVSNESSQHQGNDKATMNKEVTTENKKTTTQDEKVTVANNEVSTQDEKITAKNNEVATQNEKVMATKKEVTTQNEKDTPHLKEISMTKKEDVHDEHITEADREKELFRLAQMKLQNQQSEQAMVERQQTQQNQASNTIQNNSGSQGASGQPASQTHTGSEATQGNSKPKEMGKFKTDVLAKQIKMLQEMKQKLENVQQKSNQGKVFLNGKDQSVMTSKVGNTTDKKLTNDGAPARQKDQSVTNEKAGNTPPEGITDKKSTNGGEPKKLKEEQPAFDPYSNFRRSHLVDRIKTKKARNHKRKNIPMMPN